MREQLIEAIDKAINESALRYDVPPDADEFLRALSDLGAVVLMPVKGTPTAKNTTCWFWENTSNAALRRFMDEGETVYVNALESESE